MAVNREYKYQSRRFLTVFKHVIEKAKIKKNIKSLFKATGIQHINADRVVKSVLAEDVIFKGSVLGSEPPRSLS